MRDDPYADAPMLPEGEELDPRKLFATEDNGTDGGEAHFPVELEIGPGRGWFLFERLEAAPLVRMIGLEVRRKWATIVDRRLAQRGLSSRARVFAENAKSALPRLQSNSISIAYVHFPDPWWKKRHAKRLVLTESLLTELSRIIVPGGELFIQTDVMERADEYEARVGACPDFSSYSGQARIGDNPYGARSPRERKSLEHGLPVVRLRYRRVEPEDRKPEREHMISKDSAAARLPAAVPSREPLSG